jgi:hypothetical protein
VICKGRELLARLIIAIAPRAPWASAGEPLKRRAEKARGTVIERESLAGGTLNLPKYPVEPYWER